MRVDPESGEVVYDDWHPSTPPIESVDFEAIPCAVVHFWAIWNMIDRRVDPVLERAMPRYAGRVVFVSCDTDVRHDLAAESSVVNLPALGFFRRGVHVTTRIGLLSESELAAWLTPLLADS